MALTTAQLTALAADIAADGALNTLPQNSDGAFAVAAAYNLEAAGPYIVWKTDVSTDEVRQSVVWTEYIGFTDQAERDAFALMTQNGIVNAGDVNVRQGFLDIFGGAEKAVTRANLTAISKRNATRAEALFVSEGDGTTGTPGVMTFEGNLSYRDVLNAWAA
jgi:hypothetical protein